MVATPGNALDIKSTGVVTFTSPATFSSIPLTGQKTLLSSQTASSSTAINFTGVTGYTYYILEFLEVIMSQSGDDLGVQVSTDNGSSYSATGYSQSGYAATVASALSGYNGASATYFALCQSMDNASSAAANGVVSFYCFSNAALKKNILANSGYTNSISTLYQVQTAGEWATTTAVNALRVIDMGGGTITSGKFNLYGVL